MSDVAWHPDNVRVDSFLLFIIHSIHFLRRPPGWLLPQKMTRLLSSWFGTYETPVLRKES